MSKHSYIWQAFSFLEINHLKIYNLYWTYKAFETKRFIFELINGKAVLFKFIFMEVKPNWKRIIVANSCRAFVYNLNESEKLIYKFKRRKNRKDVTTKYKKYLLEHPNIKEVDMNDLVTETSEISSPIDNSIAVPNSQDNFKKNIENEMILNSKESEPFELDLWPCENNQIDETNETINNYNLYL